MPPPNKSFERTARQRASNHVARLHSARVLRAGSRLIPALAALSEQIAIPIIRVKVTYYESGLD